MNQLCYCVMSVGANVYSWGRITVPTHCLVYYTNYVNLHPHTNYEQIAEIPEATFGDS